MKKETQCCEKCHIRTYVFSRPKDICGNVNCTCHSQSTEGRDDWNEDAERTNTLHDMYTTPPAEAPDEIEAFVEEVSWHLRKDIRSICGTYDTVITNKLEKILREKLTSLLASTDKRVAEAVKAEREKIENFILNEIDTDGSLEQQDILNKIIQTLTDDNKETT